MGLDDGKDMSSSGDDDDLTNLTWLQDRNLLRNMGVSDGVADSIIRILSEDNENVSPSSVGYPNMESSCIVPCSVPPVPYNPQVHVHAKPPYSFSSLIFMAIESSANKALPVKDIYQWIIEHFPYYQNAPNGWKNTVRHNLSLNKCFRKVDKGTEDLIPLVGKGSLWCIEPELRPNLLQAVRRTPSHIYPYMSTAKTSMQNNRNQLATSNTSKTSTNLKKGLTVERNQSSVNIPQPNFFPLLSKRLLIPIKTKKDSKEADAAVSMLTLTQCNSAEYVQILDAKSEEPNLPDAYVDDLDAPVVTVTISPTNDHNYFSRCDSPQSQAHFVLPTAISSSEEENSSDEMPNALKFQHKRILDNEDMSDDEGVKGAEALLNLASRSKRQLSEACISKRIKSTSSDDSA